ncbi:MAG: single-stranded-DNA-specific exonuclease RecJ [Oscillospiraceae bacterium]|nr:single-stranded-DNA-specific exonuclease RecJ [Oscillospiraceae bacterium]
MKKWSVSNPDVNISSVLAANGGLSPLCASVLVSRGINSLEKAQDFFNYRENGEQPLSDPFLIKDMAEAAEIISEAVDNGTSICVYGDYDCDGITATAILYSYLECLGANVSYHINMRSEGYGLCESGIRKLAEDGTELIVTVDNGISAVKEAQLIKELGMTLVITDHHQPGEVLPEAAAVVDPHRQDCPSPFKDLCGCGVALKLIAAMDGGDYSAALEQFSDLAAIATIADVVPLVGENREIVTQGLHYLENTENPGLQALIACAKAKTPMSAVSVAFTLSPRINASGRFGSAEDAVKLFLSDSPEEAQQYAELLDSLNSQRKETEAEIMREIEERIKKGPAIIHKRVTVLYGKGWHHGVIGIVAARLVERFGKPVFILSDDGEYARGSARSVSGFSIFDALTHCSHLLDKFGGHTGAGGFSLKESSVAEFDEALQEYAAASFEHAPVYTVHADKIISPQELTVDNIRSLSVLEPYGEANKQPMFVMQNVRLLEVMSLSQGLHTKLKLTYGNRGFFGLMFGQKTEQFPYKAGDFLDMLVYAELNTYNGQTSVNLRIADVRPSGISQPKYFSAKEAYEKYRLGEELPLPLLKRMAPTREELVRIYRLIPAGKAVSCDNAFAKLDSTVIPYCKFRIALDIFEELDFIKYDIFNDEAVRNTDVKKTPLDSSAIFRTLLSLTT